MKNKIITLSFLLYVLFFTAGSVILKDRSFSDMENRELQTMPNLSLKTVADGSFMSDFETYMSDQVILKDELVKLKTSMSRALNQTLINDVYFADDDMLIQNYVNPYGQLNINLSYINDFAENNPEFEYTWLLVPNACYIYSDKLPEYASCYDQGEVMAYIEGKITDEINLVNPYDELYDNRDDYIFYRTDHHWTMNGAYIGYTELCKALGVNPMSKEDYNINIASTEFYGTLYSKAPVFNQKSDSILLYENPDGEYKVEYLDENTEDDSVYTYDNLNIKDKYTVYLDGNHSILKITSNAENTEPILVIKDSYAHSLLPLLADTYSEIHVIDLRYYHQSVSEYAGENGITKIIYINNVDFISTDNNFLWLY